MAMGEDLTNEAAVSCCPASTTRSKEEVTRPANVLASVRKALTLNPARKRELATISAQDMELGAALGVGSFSQVFAVKLTNFIPNLDVANEDELSQTETEIEEAGTGPTTTPLSANSQKLDSKTISFASTSSHHSSARPKYALKRIRGDQDEKIEAHPDHRLHRQHC